ncbi:hypothetical protein L6452_27526 [Arctium lappa]|uniref:Uncharacterized protein n=1 Tax=Arctium lappa TaxID=4217 RepID=A0ACB8ZWP9_ARCLA|nr:hypothetical protein L6452_27526 [Arctium lappa]
MHCRSGVTLRCDSAICHCRGHCRPGCTEGPFSLATLPCYSSLWHCSQTRTKSLSTVFSTVLSEHLMPLCQLSCHFHNSWHIRWDDRTLDNASVIVTYVTTAWHYTRYDHTFGTIGAIVTDVTTTCHYSRDDHTLSIIGAIVTSVTTT